MSAQRLSSRELARSSQAPTRSSERGAVLILFALLLAGLLGFAALLLDLGLARVVQGSMDGAVEGAALEGVAWRDWSMDPIDLDPARREQQRREFAREILLRAFDEDGEELEGLVLGTDPNTRVALGIGPGVSKTDSGLAGGVISIDAVALIPDPQLNLENRAYGDLVAGTFNEAFDPSICELLNGIPAGYVEGADYSRCDFAAVDASGAPELSQTEDSFLVRLRRTSDPNGLDALDGVSSSAPPLPYLFGRTATSIGDGGAAIDAGITLRGTAIAQARPALVAALPVDDDEGLLEVNVGLLEVLVDFDSDDVLVDGDGELDDDDLLGVLAVDIAVWNGLLDGAARDVVFCAGGELKLVDQIQIITPCAELPRVGRVVTPGLVTRGLVAAGESPVPIVLDINGLELGPDDFALVEPPDFAVVAIEADVGLDKRVVGFGAVEVLPPLDPPAGGVAALRLVYGPADGRDGVVLPRGASAVFVPARHPPLDAPTLSAVLAANRLSLPAPLRAAALVR